MELGHFNVTVVDKEKGTKILRYYVDGVMYRAKSGRFINRPDLAPNKFKGHFADKMWDELKFEIIKCIQAGFNPGAKHFTGLDPELPLHKKPKLGEVIARMIQLKEKEQLSKQYIRDLKTRGKLLIDFLEKENLFESDPSSFNSIHAHKFLDKFTDKSETYWNNIRTNCAILFEFALSRGLITKNPFQNIKKKKTTPVKHRPFQASQIPILFEFLRKQDKLNLILCANLTYFSFLRPHEEIRLLTRGHFSDDLRLISLKPHENKTGISRNVHVNDLARDLLLEMKVDTLDKDANIFTGVEKAFDNYYFSRSWNRISDKDKSLAQEFPGTHKQILKKHQTLYSFRATGAIAHYRKHQNIYALMIQMGHRNIATTEKYLRYYGQIHSDENTPVPDWGE
jgi:integrase